MLVELSQRGVRHWDVSLRPWGDGHLDGEEGGKDERVDLDVHAGDTLILV